MTPDIYIDVRFRTTNEEGRKTAVSGEVYACPLFIDGEAFDCRLLIGDRKLDLGKSYEVPVKFLNRDMISPKLVVGTKIILWEGKDIADGIIIRIN